MSISILLLGASALAGAAGVGGIAKGGSQVLKANSTMKELQVQHQQNLARLEKRNKECVRDMDKLGRKELEILKSFQEFSTVFEKIKNRDELMEYVPESLVKLYRHDKEHDGELIETLQAYLDCDKSANKAAEKLYVNYRTLSSRLKKIKDISGIDFKNSAEMLAVRNGIVLFKMAETL